MTVEEFSQKLDKMAGDLYDVAIGNTQTAWFEFYENFDKRFEENRDEINNDTADWTAERWKEFFYHQNNVGDMAVFKFAIQKLEETTNGQFFKNCIEENSSVLVNNVYYTADKDALKKSDILQSAVKSLNRIEGDNAKEEVLKAFRLCDSVNEHILYDLAEYIAKKCKDYVPSLILDEEIHSEKLIALLSLCIETNQKSDEIYAAMKKRFKDTPDNDENKDVFVALFGDYGEPNAILMLRKYAKKLIENYKTTGDRERFTKIMMVASVIEGLGGNTEDIMP